MMTSIPHLCWGRLIGTILTLIFSAGLATHGLAAGKEPDVCRDARYRVRLMGETPAKVERLQ